MTVPTRNNAFRSRNKNSDLGENSLRRSGGISPDEGTSEIPSSRENEIVYCAICKNPINGLFIILPECKHAFHPKHYIAWSEENQSCPVPGCDCQYNYNQKSGSLL